MNTPTSGRHLRAAIVALILGAVVFGALALFDGTTPAADADPPTLTATGADTNVDEGVAVMPFSGASVTTLAVGEGITALVVTVDIEEGNSERLLFNGASMQLNDLNSAVGGTVTGTVAQVGGPSGIATVTFEFSPAADALTVETFIDALEYKHGGNVPTEGDRVPTITSITHDAGTPGITADDETALLTITSSVRVIGVNDNPTWTELPTDITVAENTASPVDLRPIPASTPPFRGQFGDVDAQNFDITLTLVADAGTLTGVDTGGVVATGNGTATLVLTGRSLDINNYLGTAANIQYTGPVGLSGDDAATLTPTANDGGNTGTGGGDDVAFAAINIDIEPTPVLAVCFDKYLGRDVRDVPGIDVETNAPWVFNVESQGQSIPVVELQECEGLGFIVAAGAEFTLSETIDPAFAPHVSMVDAQCTIRPFEGANEDFFADENGVVTATAPAPNQGSVSCFIENDTIKVCVYKDFGSGAQALMYASLYDGNATFSLDGGAAGQLGPNGCEGPSVTYYIAPGRSFTISETIDENSPVQPIAIECEQFVQRQESQSIVGAAELDNASVAIDTFVDKVGPIECTFTNDALIVCVTKTLGENASQIATPGDFAFDLTPDGGSEQQLVPNPEDPLCGGQRGRIAIGYSGSAGTALAPGTTFSIAEQDPGSQFGLVDASCQAGQSSFPLTDGTSTIENISAPEGVSRVDCYFTNESVLVCVAKDSFTEPFDSSPVFAVTADGESVPLGSPESNPCDLEGDNSFYVYVRPDSDVVITETLPEGSPIGLTSAQCATSALPLDTTLEGQTVSFTVAEQSPVNCLLVNAYRVVCVTKTVLAGAVMAGHSASDFAFDVTFDGLAAPTVDAQPCEVESSDTTATSAFAVAPDSTVLVQERSATETGSSLRYAATRISCDVSDGEQAVGDLDAGSVTFESGLTSSVFSCFFDNDTVVVTLNKTLITDDGATALVGDFLFDVFDSDGAELESGLSTGAVFYVAPRSSFTVSERAAVGFTSSATCSDVTAADTQALSAAASVTHTPGAGVSQVVCTFVNDDIAPIPVCAMLIFEEGSTGFTLADFSLELFKDGAIIGQRSAGDPFDAACDTSTDTTADLLPGSLVQLGEVFADGSTFAFAVSIADPDELLVFEPLSCSVDAPGAAAQALAGPDPATFTVDPGTSRVNCLASAAEKPLVVGGGPSTPGGERPTYVEPVVGAAAPAATQPVQVVQPVVTPIALTGSSTTGVTMPIAFGLLSAGFVGLGIDRRRRNKNELD